LQGRSDDLATEDGDLVAEHDHLDGQVGAIAPTEAHQLKDLDEGEISN